MKKPRDYKKSKNTQSTTFVELNEYIISFLKCNTIFTGDNKLDRYLCMCRYHNNLILCISTIKNGFNVKIKIEGVKYNEKEPKNSLIRVREVKFYKDEEYDKI